MEIIRGLLLICRGSLFGLGSLINFTRVLTNYILPFQEIRSSKLFEGRLISWWLGELSGGRIKSFTNDRRCNLLLSLGFIISCWAQEDGRLRRDDNRDCKVGASLHLKEKKQKKKNLSQQVSSENFHLQFNPFCWCHFQVKLEVIVIRLLSQPPVLYDKHCMIKESRTTYVAWDGQETGLQYP